MEKQKTYLLTEEMLGRINRIICECGYCEDEWIEIKKTIGAD